MAQNYKPMGEAPRNKKLYFVGFSEFNCKGFFESWRIFPQINHHIEDGAVDTTNKFGLGKGRFLKVQAPENSVTGFGFIFLDKSNCAYFFFKFFFFEGLEKVTSFITKNLGFNQHEPWELCFSKIHV